MKWCAIFILVVVPLVALADEVTTRNGRNISGQVSFVHGKVVVQTAATQVDIEAGNIGHIVFAPATQPFKEQLHGLKGEYFDDVDLKNVVLTRLDRGLQMGWYAGIPGPGVPNHFSARWSGFLTAPYSETYSISVEHDDGVRMWIDDKLVIDQWVKGHKHDGCNVAMIGMKATPIRIELFNDKDAASIDVRWSSPSLPGEVMPTFRLSPPVDFDPVKAAAPHVKETGHGVLGEYYPDKNLSGMLLSRIDPAINFDWQYKSPGPNVGRDFAARWTAHLTPPRSDTYQFTTDSRGGARLWIDNKLVVDNWFPSHANLTGSIALEGSKPVMLTVAYYSGPQDGQIQARWSSPHLKEQIIASDALTPATLDERRAVMRSHGVRAEYFSDDSFKKRLVLRRDARLNFLWYARDPLNRPDPSLPENFAARWTGFLTPPRDGLYTFYNKAAAAARVYIDGKPVIDKWHERSGEYSAQVQLTGGQKYDLKVELSNRQGGTAEETLWWSLPDLARQVVEAEYLSPPADDPPCLPEINLSVTDKEYFLAGEAISLLANCWVDPADHLKRMDFLADGNVVATPDKPPFAMEFRTLPAGYHTVGARVTDDIDYVTPAAQVGVLVADRAAGKLSDDWADLHIGDSAIEPMKADGDRYIVSAAQGEIWEAVDDFRYTFRSLEGNGQLVVRVDSLTTDKPGTIPAAGLMIRDGLTGAARHVSLLLSGTGNDLSATFMHRDQPGRDNQILNGVAAKMPCWLKLTRNGNQIDTFISADAIHWSATGGVELELPPRVDVGFIVTAKGEGKATATFEQLSLHAGKPEVFTRAAGLQTVGGTFLAGELREANSETMRFFFHGKDLNFKTSDVAKVLFSPLPAEIYAALPLGQKGVILRTGDFSEGEFSAYRDRTVAISSVIFGAQNYSTPEQAAGIVFHDVDAKGEYQIKAADGSIYRTDEIEIEGDRIRFTDPIAGEVRLKSDQILIVERKDSSP